jgi:hypothetical protein
MAGIVDKVYSIWEDLENSYEKMGEGNSRREFLLKIIGLQDDGSTKLGALKSSLMDNYIGNEEKCDTLVKIFDAIAENTNVLKEADITDLNEYVGGMTVARERTSSLVLTTVSDDFFINLNPYSGVKDIPTLSLDTLIEVTGFATDVFKEDGSGILGFHSSEDVIVFKGGSSVAEFIQGIERGNEFYLKAHKIVQKLLNKDEMPTYILFVDGDKVNVRGSKAKLKLNDNDVTFRVDEKGKLGGFSYAICAHTNDYLETPVYVIQ